MNTSFDLYTTQPYTPDIQHLFFDTDLTIIETHVTKNWIEIQNGLAANLLIIEAPRNEMQALHARISNLIHRLMKLTEWMVECFCCVIENQLYICSFNPMNDSFKDAKSFFTNKSFSIEAYQTQSTLEKAKRLYSLLTLNYHGHEIEQLKPWLRQEANSTIHVLAALAAEVLLIWGEPHVPPQAWRVIADEDGNDHSLLTPSPSFTPHRGANFEDRINVGAYNYFESVHPSYARQSVVLVNQALTALHTTAHTSQGLNRCLDIGTGPGAALLMQNELLPNYHFTAIEPSPAAFRYLAQNVASYSNITPIHSDILQYDCEERFNTILSTGASHHLNTYAFFAKAARLLSADGVFVVADEMISPYASREQRKINVMIHHSVYMLSLMTRLRTIDINEFSASEIQLTQFILNYLPVAFVYAKLGKAKIAEELYKSLLQQINQLNLSNQISSPNVSFYRLIHLELEALVAGIDYEVEQKTYPDMLMRLAKFANLDCIHHECVHNTSGMNEKYSGTHVFTFMHRMTHS